MLEYNHCLLSYIILFYCIYIFFIQRRKYVIYFYKTI